MVHILRTIENGNSQTMVLHSPQKMCLIEPWIELVGVTVSKIQPHPLIHGTELSDSFMPPYIQRAV